MSLITLEPRDAINFELALNLTPYSKSQEKLGDRLFDIHVSEETTTIVVSNFQYKLLESLRHIIEINPKDFYINKNLYKNMMI